jgi:membrane fusion protein (multidrug efflux system)
MTTPTPEAVSASRERSDGPGLSRRRLLLILTAIFAAGLCAYLAYQRLYGRVYESTEDAYVGGNLVQLMPQVSGSVLTIYADDTDLVHAGQAIVTLDAADRDIALEQAEAELAKAVREVRALFAGRDQLTAEVGVRRAELARAQSDVERREGLTARGLVPRRTGSRTRCAEQRAGFSASGS